MVRSLWSAASGMISQQASIDNISNNLSNVNTPGYKKMRAEFEDLIYQNVRVAGTPATEDTVTPVPVQMGHGSKLSATSRQFQQGALQNTENNTTSPSRATASSASRATTAPTPIRATAPSRSTRTASS